MVAIESTSPAAPSTNVLATRATASSPPGPASTSTALSASRRAVSTCERFVVSPLVSSATDTATLLYAAPIVAMRLRSRGAGVNAIVATAYHSPPTAKSRTDAATLSCSVKKTPDRNAVGGIVPHRATVAPNTAPMDAMNTRAAKTATSSGNNRGATAPTANAAVLTIEANTSPLVRLQRWPPSLVNAAM